MNTYESIVPVVCIDEDGSVSKYFTPKECAIANNIKPSTLNERLNKAGSKSYDGKYYLRYSDYIRN